MSTELKDGDRWPMPWPEGEIATRMDADAKAMWETNVWRDLREKYAFEEDHPLKQTLIDIWFDGKED